MHEVFRYFKLFFNVSWDRCNLDELEFPLVNDYHNYELSKIILEEQIEEMVIEANVNKSLGLDGFNFSLFEFFFWGGGGVEIGCESHV